MRHRLRQLRRAAWYAAAGVLVTMALVAGAVSQLLPLAERHPERIAEWLSARAQRPVRFDHVETEWTRRGPLLRLDGLRIGDGADAVPIGAAEILVSQYAGLLPGRSFTELRLRGLDLTLQRDDDGRWTVRGLPGKSTRDPFAQLQGLGELQVIGGKLHIDAPALGIDARLPLIDVRLQVDDHDVRIGARARMTVDAAPIEASVRFDRARGDGRAYLATGDADLAAWSSLLHAAGVEVTGGSGRLRAWAELRAHRVSAVTLDADLQGLALRGAPLDGMAQPPTAVFETLRAQGRWQTGDGGWRVDLPTLRLGALAKPQSLDGLTVAGGRRVALLADRIQAGPLLQIVALSDRASPALRRWLLASKPDVQLREVAVAGAGGALRGHARIDGAHFTAVGASPGLSGLSGELDGDGDGFTFAFDKAATLRFDWPPGFGVPHDVRLDGRVAGWRDGGGWRIETPALRVQGTGYGADVRGGLTFQGDGTRPTIDLAAQVDDAQVAVAQRFWVRNAMSAGTVHWLENGLVGGRVVDGRALVSGDLDDWPFRSESGQAAKGLFHATARLQGAEVKFLRDWPAADHIDADVDFFATGFTLEGRGAIAGVTLPRLEGGIADYKTAELSVGADADTDASKLLAMLRQSPLQKAHAETFDALSASGPATASVAIDVPLRIKPVVPTIDGRIVLDGARLAHSRFRLAFDDVHGNAAFDRSGFDADGLRAIKGGQPGLLALRAGDGHVRDAAQAFEAELDANLSASELLDQAPDLAWLKPYFSGRSPWSVAVAIPKTPAAGALPTATALPTRLRLRSTLVGTGIDLPAPLRKPAQALLATSVDTALPLGDGEVAVAFGQRLALRARSGGGRTGIRVQVGAARVDEAPPPSGLIATGRAGDLDAIDWATLAAGGGQKTDAAPSGSPSLALQRVDVSADRLKLLGGTFANARVRAAPSATGTAVQVDGDTLAGTLTLPKAAGATIAGRFSRVYWAAPPATPAVKSALASTDAPDLAADVDPAKIPPLDVRIDDLRFGEAALGPTIVRTQPVAGGLRIVELMTGAGQQQVSVTGDWLGRGDAARTRLKVDVTSGDFGKLLSGFGFGGRLTGGAGEGHLDAAWPGSPAGFKLGGLEGRLSLVAKDGQLVELDPGAGRVLGLLSVAQLPRRLMLDFRDFFSKGFAFNRIGGNVRFAGGQASSDDMSIDGPAAEIRIRGAADLRAETFDQTIEVLPKSGNLLTVAGALAGGPVGAAVGAVANAVLKKPLGEVGAKTYRVTGPWKDPKVEVSRREDADVPQAADAPAAAG